MIESGALIQTYVDTDIELQDAELLMPANDQNLFEDDVRRYVLCLILSEI